jgi:sigma-E factor negative regulatory protein RseC
VEVSGNNNVTVRISSASACSACHAEGTCTMSGHEEKIINISGLYNVSPGDKVTVLMKQSAGYEALFLGYILPLLLVLVLLVVLITASVSELTSGLISVSALVPYYGILWLLRKQIGKKFTFTIKD